MDDYERLDFWDKNNKDKYFGYAVSLSKKDLQECYITYALTGVFVSPVKLIREYEEVRQA